MNFPKFFSVFLLVITCTCCSPLIGNLDLQPLNFVLIDSTGKNVSQDIFNKSLIISYTINDTKTIIKDLQISSLTKKYTTILGSHSILPTAADQNVVDFTLSANDSILGKISLKAKKVERGYVPTSVMWNGILLSVQPSSETGVEFGYIIKL